LECCSNGADLDAFTVAIKNGVSGIKKILELKDCQPSVKSLEKPEILAVSSNISLN
jgi:hypothetical protein